MTFLYQFLNDVFEEVILGGMGTVNQDSHLIIAFCDDFLELKTGFIDFSKKDIIPAALKI